MGYNHSHQKRFCTKLEVTSIEESVIYKNEANKSNYTTYTLKTDFNLVKPKEIIKRASSFQYSILVRTEEQLQIALRNNMDYI